MSFIIIRTLTLIQSFTNLPSLRQLSVLMTNHGLDVLLSSLQTYLQLTVIWVRVAEQSYHNRNKTKQNKTKRHCTALSACRQSCIAEIKPLMKQRNMLDKVRPKKGCQSLKI